MLDDTDFDDILEDSQSALESFWAEQRKLRELADEDTREAEAFHRRERAEVKRQTTTQEDHKVQRDDDDEPGAPPPEPPGEDVCIPGAFYSEGEEPAFNTHDEPRDHDIENGSTTYGLGWLNYSAPADDERLWAVCRRIIEYTRAPDSEGGNLSDKLVLSSDPDGGADPGGPTTSFEIAPTDLTTALLSMGSPPDTTVRMRVRIYVTTFRKVKKKPYPPDVRPGMGLGYDWHKGPTLGTIADSIAYIIKLAYATCA